MEYINLAINNACQVFPILHDPGYFLPLTSLLSPMAIFFRVLLNQHHILG